MALRGKKPEQIQKRLKCLFYGAAGMGKTTAAISFPNTYLIDTEDGATHDKYVKLLEQNNSVSFQTTNADEVIEEVKELMTTEHPYKTLVIDPLTHIYDQMIDASEETEGNQYGRHIASAKKKMKKFLSLLTRLDMNVIITAHSKILYKSIRGKDGKNEMIADGETFDCYNKLDFLFDLVFEIKTVGNTRMAIVKKSRVDGFELGASFPFSYDYIANTYGREIVEKTTTKETLATPEQITEINRLIELFNGSEELLAKLLKKFNSESIEDLSTENAAVIIEFLISKVTGDKK